MAKALIGYLNSDSRIPGQLTVENARLRARVRDLEELVLSLQQENDRLVTAQADLLETSMHDVDADSGERHAMQPA